MLNLLNNKKQTVMVVNKNLCAAIIADKFMEFYTGDITSIDWTPKSMKIILRNGKECLLNNVSVSSANKFMMYLRRI